MEPATLPKKHHKIARLLRKVREEKGLRQVDVAQALGVPQYFVSRYESAERRLDFVEVADICKALDITVADFVRRFESAR